MNNLKLLKLIILAVTVLSFISCGPGIYQSSNWKATVHKVRYEEDFGVGPNKYDGLVIDISVEYIGPDGKVPPPAIYLKKGSEPESRATLVQTNKSDPASDLIIRAWLGDKGTKFDMKKGDTLSKAPLSFLWSIKGKGGRFKLLIGDIPPITIYL